MQNSTLLGTVTDPGYVPTSDEKTIALLSHIICFVAPFLGPLIIYLVKKDDSAFVASHAKESLNFQITLLIIIILFCISIVGLVFAWIPPIIGAVLVIVATVRASEGMLYRYPFNIRLIK